MVKLYCARIECKYNENEKCKAETVNLGAWYGNTINEGYQEFSRCRTYEDSEETIRVKKFLAKLKGENSEGKYPFEHPNNLTKEKRKSV